MLTLIQFGDASKVDHESIVTPAPAHPVSRFQVQERAVQTRGNATNTGVDLEVCRPVTQRK